MPDGASRQQLSARGHAGGPAATGRRGWRPGLAVAVLGALVLVGQPARVDAQQTADRAHISVSPTIVAPAASQTLLGIKVGPPGALPRRGFVSLRGLPANVSLTEGHLVGVGSWAIPVGALPRLKANVPVDVSGRSELVISLISIEGSLLALVRTALVVAPQALVPPAERGPADPGKEAVPPPAPAPSFEPEPEVRLARGGPPAEERRAGPGAR